MTHSDRNPFKSSADLLIATMALLALVLLLLRSEAGRRHLSPPPQRIGIEARLWELKQGARDLPAKSQSRLEALLHAGPESSLPAWDQALFSILVAEKGDLAKGRSLALEAQVPPGPAGEAFRRCWSAAYLGEGRVPDGADRAAVKHALRNGYAARLLEARLEERNGKTALLLREDAQRWAHQRFLLLMALGGLIVLSLGAGAVFGLLLGATWQRPHPEPGPVVSLSGRAVMITFLGWFLAYLLSGTLIGGLLGLLPVLRPLAVYLMYGLHATVGLSLLCHFQGLNLAGLAKSLFSKTPWRSVGWAFGFVALAVTTVLITTIVLSPFLRSQEPPQRELMELVTGASSLWTLLPFFLLAAVCAPLFEEILFRGTLLPWLEQRLQKALGVRWGWPLALTLSALAFGTIHLEPAALPTLSALGFILGLAFLRSGSLMTSVVVHGIWNGSVLIFYRTLLA